MARHRRLWLLRLVLFPDRYVYLISPRMWVWIAGALIAARRGRFVALRLQNSKLVDEVARRSLRSRVAGLALRRFDRVVSVNAELVEALERLGVAPSTIRHFPGYLPPADDEFLPESVSADVWQFVKPRHPLIASTGRVGWHQGRDTYGLDHLVELVGRLVMDHPSLGLVVCLWDYHPVRDEARLRELEERAEELGVRDRIFFNRSRGGFLPILRVADVMVRPTATDGEANTIREALALGVPVVASDVVKRPVGTVVVPTTDPTALHLAVRRVLADGASPVLSNEAEAARQRSAEYVDELCRWLRLPSESG